MISIMQWILRYARPACHEQIVWLRGGGLSGGRRRFAVLLALPLVISLASGLYAAEIPNATGSPQNQAAPKSPASNAGEVLTLQVQLNESRRFQEQILATVHWSLGVVATVAILLVGFGWFVNVRVYDRDRAALERELHYQFQEELTRAKSEANSLHEAQLEEFRKSAEQSIIDRLEEIRVAFADSQKDLSQRIASRINRIQADVGELQFDSLQQQRRDWLNGQIPVPLNGLMSSIQALRVALRLEHEYKIQRVLDNITSDIAALHKTFRSSVESGVLSQLFEILDQVRGNYSQNARILKAKAEELLTSSRAKSGALDSR